MYDAARGARSTATYAEPCPIAERRGWPDCKARAEYRQAAPEVAAECGPSVSARLRLGSQGGAPGTAERSEAFYQKVEDQMIRQFKQGTARWTQAWRPRETSMPRNVVTAKAYRGGNSVLLARHRLVAGAGIPKATSMPSTDCCGSRTRS